MTIQASEGILDVLSEWEGPYVGHGRYHNAAGDLYYGSWGPLCEAYRRSVGGMWVEVRVFADGSREETFQSPAPGTHPEHPDLPADVASWSDATDVELRAIYWACRSLAPPQARDFVRAVF